MTTKIKNIHIIGLLIIAIFIVSACNNRNNKVSDKIILQIDTLKITEYELEKSLDNFKKMHPNASKNEIDKWRNEYIGNTYFLVEAYRNHLDTTKVVKTKTKIIIKSNNSQVEGPLWEQIEEPTIYTSKEEVEKAYNMLDKGFYFKVLKFKSNRVLKNELRNDTIINSETKFNSIASKIKNNNNEIELLKFNANWPFKFLYEFRETLYNLKEKEVSSIMHSIDGTCYIVYVEKKETIKKQPLNKIKEYLIDQIKQIKTISIAKKDEKEIADNVKRKYNSIAFLPFLNQINSSALKDSTFKNVIANYQINGLLKTIYVSDFLDYLYYDYYPVAGFDKVEDIYTWVNKIIADDYHYQKAYKLGVTKSKAFILSSRYFLNKFTLNAYIDNLYKNIKSDSSEIINYYKTNKSKFFETKKCFGIILTFKDYKSYEDNYYNIGSLLLKGDYKSIKDTSKIKGLLKFDANVILERGLNTFSEKFIENTIKSPANTFANGIELENKNYVTFFKIKEEGKTVKNIEQVRAEIQYEIENSKKNVLNNQRLKLLRNKYKMVFDATKDYVK